MPKLPRPSFSLYIGFAFGLVQWALTLWGVAVNLWLGCTLWVVIIGLFVDVVWRSEWTTKKSILTKGVLTGVVVILMVLIARKPVSDQYAREHPDKSPLVAAEPRSQEATRRHDLIERLRQEYILSHDNVSPALLAGTEQPPAAWINKRLKELGETWVVSLPPVREKPSAAHREGSRPPASLSTPLPKGPRLGIGPDAYKNLDDVQVGQWAVEEADKIEQMAVDCMSPSPNGPSTKARMFFFSNEFKKCCAQDVKELRIEILRRLGPPAKDPKEESAWEFLFPSVQFSGPPMDINPMAVKEYAQHLRRLGLKLKRRSVPRAAPRELHFTEQQLAASCG